MIAVGGTWGALTHQIVPETAIMLARAARAAREILA
jgi:hypothetical protein